MKSQKRKEKILKDLKKIFKKHGLKVGADNSKVVESIYKESEFWLFIAFEEIRLPKKTRKNA